MMGQGIVVLDETTCMVDLARFFLSFTQRNCAASAFHAGSHRHMVNLLEKITEGKGTQDDLVKLENLANKVKMGSLCGLGQTAPTRADALRYFRSEFVAHVVDKRCPAISCERSSPSGLCRTVAQDVCSASRSVRRAITGPRAQPQTLDQSKCIKCRSCYEICRFDAIAATPLSSNRERGS